MVAIVSPLKHKNTNKPIMSNRQKAQNIEVLRAKGKNSTYIISYIKVQKRCIRVIHQNHRKLVQCTDVCKIVTCRVC